MKSNWKASGRLLLHDLLCLLFWWNDGVRAIAAISSIKQLDRFMEFRFMDGRYGWHPLQSLWEIVAAQKREQLLRLDRSQDPSSILGSPCHWTSESETTRRLQHQGLRQRRAPDTQLGSLGAARHLDHADEAPSCDAERYGQIDRSTQSGHDEPLEIAPMEDQGSRNSSFLHNVRCAPTGAIERRKK